MHQIIWNTLQRYIPGGYEKTYSSGPVKSLAAAVSQLGSDEGWKQLWARAEQEQGWVKREKGMGLSSWMRCWHDGCWPASAAVAAVVVCWIKKRKIAGEVQPLHRLIGGSKPRRRAGARGEPNGTRI
ncbi:hypothetical protein ACLOJK_037359, partial [Asimina triloba]